MYIHSKSAACVISIIINKPAVSYTPKQIDLQAFFVITAVLLCQHAIRCKLATVQYKCCYYLVPPQSILIKQTKLMLCKPLFIDHGRVT